MDSRKRWSLSALRRHTCDHRKTIAGGGAVPAGSKGISGKAVRPYSVTEGFSCRHRHGCGKTLTLEGKKTFDEAELLIGAKRMTDAVQRPGQMVLHEYRSDKIVEYIKTHPQYRTVAIALSGDVGFYSGARKLIDLLDGDVQVICGISSVVYFMAKIGLSWMMPGSSALMEETAI